MYVYVAMGDYKKSRCCVSHMVLSVWCDTMYYQSASFCASMLVVSPSSGTTGTEGRKVTSFTCTSWERSGERTFKPQYDLTRCTLTCTHKGSTLIKQGHLCNEENAYHLSRQRNVYKSYCTAQIKMAPPLLVRIWADPEVLGGCDNVTSHS